MTEFTCEASALARVMRHVNELSIDTKETIALLRNVKIDVTANQATFTRCNFNGSISRTIPVQSEVDGVFTVDATKLASIAGTFPDGAQAKLSEADGWATLTAARSRVRLATLAPDTFPVLSFEEGIAAFDLGEGFLTGLSRASFAASVDTIKDVWCGVSVKWVDGKIELAATDGNRMAIVVADGAEMPNAIIPNSAVTLLLKLSGEAEKVHMEISATRVRWTMGDVTITHKLIDGKFPLYQQLVREKSDNTAVLDCDDLRNSLVRIGMLADDQDRTAELEFSAHKLTMRSRGSGDQGTDEIPCEYPGPELRIDVRSKFLRECLTALDADTVQFAMMGSRDPIMVRADQRPETLIVIMPMLS